MIIGFTTNQAPGAIRNNTLIKKCNSEPGDANPDGTLGRVLGSIGPYTVGAYPDRYGYFVEWETQLGRPVFIRETRIRRADGR